MLSKLLQHIILPIGDFLTGSNFVRDLHYWRKVDLFSEEKLEKLQKERLENILSFAQKNSKFYSKYTSEKDVIKWLKKFPIINKKIINSQVEILLTQSKDNLTKISSSGSSGVQSSVYMNKEDLSVLRAGLVHWWEWSGYTLGHPIIQTGITPKRGFLKLIKDILFRTIYINAFIHSEEQIIKVLRKIENKNYILIGYASSLNVIADVAKKFHYKIKLKTVISLGDKLFNHYRKNISSVFNCKVYDTYGSAEGFLIAAQHDLDYLYILSPQIYIEIVDDYGNEVKDGEMGHIVVTRLDGFAMPLIRYKIGDLGIKLPKEKYPKQRKFNYPLLQQIVGRDTDVVKTKDGKTMVVHSFTGIFEYISEVKQFKIIQYSLNGITIEIVKGEMFNYETLLLVEQKMQEIIKNKRFNITFKIVEKINPSKSGKPQIIESYL